MAGGAFIITITIIIYFKSDLDLIFPTLNAARDCSSMHISMHVCTHTYA